MRSTIKISNNAVVKLTFFIALIGVAFILDIYFDKHPVKLDEIKEGKEENADLQSIFYFTIKNTPKLNKNRQ